MANKLTYQTGEPDIFVDGGPRKNLPLLRGWECEDFAPRNGATRASGERGAKKRDRRAPGRPKSGGGNVKTLLPETEPQGFAGSGEQRKEAAGRPEGEKWRPLKTPSTT